MVPVWPSQFGPLLFLQAEDGIRDGHVTGVQTCALPILAVGIALSPTGLPILVKLLITWTVSMVILVLSYDLMVRSTWVGAWLNGRRRPRAIFRAAAPAEAGR